MKKFILLILIAICSQAYGQKIVIERVLKADTIFYTGGSVKNPLNYWPLNLLDTMEQRWILDCVKHVSSTQNALSGTHSMVLTSSLSFQKKPQVVINGEIIHDCLESKREAWKSTFVVSAPGVEDDPTIVYTSSQAITKTEEVLTVEGFIRLYDAYNKTLCYDSVIAPSKVVLFITDDDSDSSHLHIDKPGYARIYSYKEATLWGFIEFLKGR